MSDAFTDDVVDLLANLRDGAWLDEQTFPELTYHLPGIIPEGFTLLVGPPKIGKSWFVLALALASAYGGRMLGMHVEHRRVLYLALEDGDRRLQDRCRTLLSENEAIPEAFHYLTEVSPGAVLRTVRAWLEKYGTGGAPPLVILDTLGKVMPPAFMGESSYQRDYRIGSAIKSIASDYPGAAILVNHHDRKAFSEDFVDSVSGTNGLAGAADTIVVLTRNRLESDGLISVTGRDVAEGSYAVKFDGPAGVWTLDGRDLSAAASTAVTRRATQGLGDRSAEVVTFVAEHAEGVRAKEVQLALGVEETQAKVYLNRLHKAGRISKPKRGLYTPVTSVTSVTSDGDLLSGSNTNNGSNSPLGDGED